MNKQWILICLACICLWAGCEDTLGPADDPESQIPLAAPEQPSLTPRNERIDVAFTTVATADSYELWYGTGPSPSTALRGPELTVAGRLVSGTITGLTNGMTYYVWTKAIYPYGASGFSEGAEAIPIPPPSTPAPPLVKQSDSGQLELSWTPVEGAESYVVYFHTTGGVSPPDNSSREEVLNTSFLLKGLDDSKSYYIWLAARNSADESPASSPVSQSPGRAGAAPQPLPQKPSLASGDGRVTVTWPGISTASSYIVYYNTTGSTPTQDNPWHKEIPATLPTVSARIDGLSNGISCYVWVQAKNSAGSSSLSPSNNTTPHGKEALNLNNSSFVVGKAAANFSTGGDRGWRKQETSIGNLFADSSAWYIRTKYPEEPIDFVLLPSRIVSGGLSKGNITIASLTTVQNTASYGYDWSLSIITLTGSQVIDLFRVAADIPRNGGGGHPTGGFHLISSEARHTIDYTTKEPNTRGVTKDLTINGVVLVKDHQPTTDSALLTKNYRIVTMQYLLEGGDDYTYYDEVYKGALDKGTANLVKTGISTRDAIAFYIYDFDEPIQPVIDGRITLIGGVVIP
ncbi:MAG: 5'-nucleotidase C-terminal domain-containing protein [Treponema sp.]|nr:5'-nucleotidase C-terminal domain-containing protein [Treponema sp.]